MKWNTTGNISKPRGWLISKLLITHPGIFKNISFNGEDDDGGTSASFKQMIKLINHQTKLGDVDKHLDVFIVWIVHWHPNEICIFFLYNVYHITAPTGYLHIQYFTRLYPKAVCESNTPNSPPDITRTKKSLRTVRSWAENHTKPHFCGNLNFYV